MYQKKNCWITLHCLWLEHGLNGFIIMMPAAMVWADAALHNSPAEEGLYLNDMLDVFCFLQTTACCPLPAAVVFLLLQHVGAFLWHRPFCVELTSSPCWSLCVSPVMTWRLVQGVPPNVSPVLRPRPCQGEAVITWWMDAGWLFNL